MSGFGGVGGAGGRQRRTRGYGERMTGFNTRPSTRVRSRTHDRAHHRAPSTRPRLHKQDGVGGLRGGYEYSRSANPPGPRWKWRSRRSRLTAHAAGLCLRACRRRHLATNRVAVPATTSCCRTTRVRRTFRLVARVLDRWGLEHTRSATPGSRCGARCRGRPRTRSSGVRRRRTRCSVSRTWLRTGPARPTAPGPARCRQHVRHALLAAAHRLRADVVVHSTTKYLGGRFRRDRWGAGDRRPRTQRRNSRSTRTPWARSPARSTRGWCCVA